MRKSRAERSGTVFYTVMDDEVRREERRGSYSEMSSEKYAKLSGSRMAVLSFSELFL